MRLKLIGGIGATFTAMTLSVALAAAVMLPLATRLDNNDVSITWNASTRAGVASYEVLQCPYKSAPDAKCATVATNGLTALIAASDVLTTTKPFAKVLPLDAAGVEVGTPSNAHAFRENVAIPPVLGTTPDAIKIWVPLIAR
jgi:hypothetical protein